MHKRNVLARVSAFLYVVLRLRVSTQEQSVDAADVATPAPPVICSFWKQNAVELACRRLLQVTKLGEC